MAGGLWTNKTPPSKKFFLSTEQLLLDANYAMLSRTQWVAWATQLENAGLTSTEANSQYDEAMANPKIPRDMLGINPRDPQRVCMKISDTVTFRDAQIQAQVMTLKGQEKLAKTRVFRSVYGKIHTWPEEGLRL